jgi:Big-like domain-containing protein
MPSSIPPQPDVLTITPPREALKVGETETLSAVVVSGNGTRRTVAASWSSDTPEVAAIGEDGRVWAMRLGKATIKAAFEVLSAVQPMRVVPNYEGIWSGDYRIVQCEQLGGNVDICDQGGVLPMRTAVTQKGATLSGTLDFFSSGGRLVESGVVEGQLDESGALVLTGTTISDPEQPGQTKVTDWNTSLTGDGSQMTGHFTKNRHFRNFFGWQDSRESCELLNVARSRP